MQQLASQQRCIPFVRCFPLSFGCIQRTKLCKWRLSSHKPSLWFECERTGVKRDASDYIPARSVQNKSCWAGFQSIRGTQSSACWGYNGLITAPCFTREKTRLHSIRHQGVSFLSPCSLPQTGGHCCLCWPLTCATKCLCNRGMWKWVIFREIEHLWNVGLWCKHVSRRAHHFYDLAELWVCGGTLESGSVNFVFHVDGWMCPSQLFVCSVTREVNRFNMRYCAVRSGS